jgi:hypothetical protein
VEVLSLLHMPLVLDGWLTFLSGVGEPLQVAKLKAPGTIGVVLEGGLTEVG